MDKPEVKKNLENLKPGEMFFESGLGSYGSYRTRASTLKREQGRIIKVKKTVAVGLDPDGSVYTTIEGLLIKREE